MDLICMYMLRLDTKHAGIYSKSVRRNQQVKRMADLLIISVVFQSERSVLQIRFVSDLPPL